MYYEIKDAIDKNHVGFLLGPRKCGKTICLKQLKDYYKNAVYVDVKSEFNSDEEKRRFISQVVKDIKDDKDVLYLIDEVTYLDCPDKAIGKIGDAYSECDNDNTKIIFAGSQSKALDQWGHSSFAGNTFFIKSDFLSYPEWLAYKGITDVSESTYIDFISHTKDFYSDFVDIKDYLRGCLDETVISNFKSIEYVIDNDPGEIDTEMLLDTLYASMISLHNHSSYEKFQDSNVFAKTIANYFATEDLGITDEELKSRTVEFLSDRYSRFKQMSVHDCKKSLQFLSNCGLITFTPVTDNPDMVDPYVTGKILKDTNDIFNKKDLFIKYNVTMNYPMFYVDMVKSVLGEQMPSELPRRLVGNIMECHVRGLLPNTGCYEYRDGDGNEVDYVTVGGRAIEFSITNKDTRDTKFKLIPNLHEKILLTKNKSTTIRDVKCIPYYKYIFDSSIGKEMVEKIARIEKQVNNEELNQLLNNIEQNTDINIDANRKGPGE